MVLQGRVAVAYAVLQGRAVVCSYAGKSGCVQFYGEARVVVCGSPGKSGCDGSYWQPRGIYTNLRQLQACHDHKWLARRENKDKTTRE